MEIDKLAVVHPKAELAADVVVGPFTTIGPAVRIGPGTVIGPNCLIEGRTTIGADNRLVAHVALGTPPQDATWRGEETELIIGDGNVFREFTQVNSGTRKAGGRTVIGNGNFIMGQSHIAHDCELADTISMANLARLGGHVRVESNVVLGGIVAVHHFATIGRCAFIAGMTGVPMDVPPFMLVEGTRDAVPRSVNVVGLKRAGFTKERINALKRAHRVIWRSDYTRTEAMKMLEDDPDSTEDVRYLVAFLRRMGESPRGRARELERESWNE